MKSEAGARASGQGRMSGNFVLLRADSLRVLLPQEEVGSAEYVEHAPGPAGEPGVFVHGQGEATRWVVALSAAMRPLDSFPKDRFVLASLQAADSELSFAWNEVQVLIDADFERHELPVAMRVPGAPIEGYVEHDGHVVLCASAERVVSYALGGA